jgi:tight adherence protein B
MSAPGNGPLLAGLAAALAASGLATIAPLLASSPAGAGAAERLLAVGRRALGWLQAVASPETSLGRERTLRLRLVAVATVLVAVTLMLGLRPALLLAPVAAWAAPRAVHARRARHGRRVEEGAAAAALALADALSAGAAARGSIAVAAERLDGPIARELRHTAWELEMGAGTEPALDRLRERSASRGVALIVAAMQVQRRSGGDLGRVLREVAVALADERRLRAESRSATAQARFTAAVVIALPACGVALAALASPGLVGRVAGAPVAVGLVVCALGLQASGAWMIRRLAGPWE